MAFKVRCPKCQKVYAADLQWIGKRIRCKECGEGFAVEQPTDELAVQPVLNTPASRGPGAGQSHPEHAAGRSATQMAVPRAPMAAPRNSEEQANEADDAFALRNDEYPGLRPSVPQDFPMSAVVEAWLPLALGLIATVLCASQTIGQNATGRTWVAALRFGIVVVLYLLLIVPITYKSITVNFQKMRRVLPPNPMSRVAATFALPAAFAVVFWLGSGGIGGFITGLIMGLVLMAAVFWLLFRLNPQEAANAYAWASGLFLTATTVAAFIVIGLSAMLNRALIDAHAVAFRESPLGAPLAWTPPEPKPVRPLVQPSPQPSDDAVALAVKPTVPKPASPAPKDPPAETLVSSQPTSGSDTIPVNSPPVSAMVKAATTPPPTATPDTSPLFANPEDDQFVVNLRKKSLPWIKQVSRPNAQGPFDFIVTPGGTSPFVGLVTLDPNSNALRRFSVGVSTDSGLRRSPSFDVMDTAGTPRSFSHDYFLTPDGSALLHVLGREVEIIATGEKRHDTMPLTVPNRQSTASITPQIVGLSRDQSFVVRWSCPEGSEQFFQRYSYATRKLLDLGGGFRNVTSACDVTAVSNNPTGPVWFASILTPEGKRPTLYLSNASSSSGDGKFTPLPSEVTDLTHYDAELAFSPNGSKIVLMLGDSDRTLVYEWVTATLASPSLRVSLPPLAAAISMAHVTGPRLRWIDDLVFIVDGQAVIGTVPNRAGVLGTVSDTQVLATASTSKDRVLLTYPSEDGSCHAAEIDFDPVALRNAVPIKQAASSSH